MSLHGLDELGEHAAGRRWMKERNRAAAYPATWLVVYDAQAALPAELEGFRHVFASVSGMVDSGAALGDELADRRLGAERRQKLHVRVANAYKRRLDALLGDGLAMLQRHLEHLAVELDGSVQILDRHADVVNQLEHGRPSLTGARPRASGLD